MKDKKIGFNSKLIHGGDFNDALGSATVPIYQTSTFKFDNAEHGAACFAGESNGYIYTRIGNPTINALETLLAELEGGFGGIATSSGMAAVNTVYGAMLAQGDHVVSSAAVYGPSRVVLETYYKKYGVESTFVNTANFEQCMGVGWHPGQFILPASGIKFWRLAGLIYINDDPIQPLLNSAIGLLLNGIR